MNIIEQIMRIFLHATLIGMLFALSLAVDRLINRPHVEIIQHHIVPVPVPFPQEEPKIENYNDKIRKEKSWT